MDIFTIQAGSTSNMISFKLYDSSSTTGAGLTVLAYNTAGLVAYYQAESAASATAITLVAATSGTFTSSGFVVKDATNMTSVYQLGVPNAAVSSVGRVYIHIQGAANLVQKIIQLDVVGYNPNDSVRLGLTALPNVASGNAGAIITSGTGTAQLSTSSGQTTVATNNDKTGYALSAAGVDAIWDEPIAGHLTAGTTGLSEVLGSSALVDSSMTGTPTSTSFTFTGGSTSNNFYNDQLVYILSGTGIGQVRPILSSSYSGGTTTITVDEAWVTTPAVSDRFAILVSHVHPKSQLADSIWDEATAGHVTAGTYGVAVTDTLADTADMQPKLGTPAGASMSADIAAVKADTAAILIDTNELQGDWTNGGRLDLIIDAILDKTGTSGVVLTATERNAIADAILDRNMGTGTDSGSPTVRTVRQALRANRNKVSIAGGTMTVYKEDDTTASWTAAITTTAGDPISAVDPA